MALLKLWVDVERGVLVKSDRNADIMAVRNLVYGDSVTIEVMLLEPVNDAKNPYSRVDPGPYALKVAVGLLEGTPDAVQDTWTQTSGADGKFEGVLSLSTSALQAAIAGQNSINRYLAVQLNSGTGFETVAQPQVAVFNRVIPPGTVAPVPADEYLTKAECFALFVQWINDPGRKTTYVSTNGQYAVSIGCQDDASALATAEGFTP